MKLLIVRHGETLENLQRICQGQTHGTLSPVGIAEAQLIGRRLRDFTIDCCYTSDLRRATDTVAYICDQIPNMPVFQDVRLRERYFGSFQGKMFPESLSTFVPPEETESPEAIIDRLLDFLRDIEHCRRDQTILVVSHGFTIRVLLSVLMHLPETDLESVDEIRNASLTIAEIDRSDYRVLLLNDISHLDPDKMPKARVDM